MIWGLNTPIFGNTHIEQMNIIYLDYLDNMKYYEITFSIINHPFWGFSPYFGGNTHIEDGNHDVYFSSIFFVGRNVDLRVAFLGFSPLNAKRQLHARLSPVKPRSKFSGETKRAFFEPTKCGV